MDWLIFFLPFLGLFLPPILEAVEEYLERKGILPSYEELRLEIMREMMRRMEGDC